MQKMIASLVVLAALAIGAVACSSSSTDSGGTSGTAGGGGTAGTAGSAGSSGSSGSAGTGGSTGGDPVAGKAIADSKACSSCHGTDYSGSPSGPNITPSTTAGIGSWTDAQIEASITAQIRNDGVALCPTMQMYQLSETELTNLIAFLKSNTAVDTVNHGPCPH